MVSFYYLRLHAPILSWLPVTFYALSPLALIGLVMAAPRIRAMWPLYLMVATWVVSLTAFLVLGRLRALLVAAAIPFAAFTIVECFRGTRRRMLTLVAAALVVGFWTGRPLPAGQPAISTTDWLTPFLARYEAPAREALEANDPRRHAQAYQEFLRYAPDFSGMPRSGPVLLHASDRELAQVFAGVHDVCARALHAAGEPGSAGEHERQAAELRHLAGLPGGRQ
jgi:hypothetical protein